MQHILAYAGEMLPWMLLALPVWLVVRFLWLRRKREFISWPREVLLLCFVLFCVGLASQTVMPGLYLDESGRTRAVTVFSVGWEGRFNGLNLVPFRTIGQYFMRGNGALFIINILGNIGMFAPIGFFPPLLWRRWRKWYKTALLGAAASCLIECLQVFIFRSVDIDDVILNTLGTLAGYGCFALLRRVGRFARE